MMICQSVVRTQIQNKNSVFWFMKKRDYIYMRWYPIQGSMETETKLKLGWSRCLTGSTWSLYLLEPPPQVQPSAKWIRRMGAYGSKSTGHFPRIIRHQYQGPFPVHRPSFSLSSVFQRCNWLLSFTYGICERDERVPAQNLSFRLGYWSDQEFPDNGF